MNTKFKFDDFEIDFRNPLGKGGFSDVYKAKEKRTGKIYAIKRVKIGDLNEEEINNMLIMNNYENSVKFYGFFKDKNLIYLIMELCDYSLDEIISEKKLNVREIKEILEQLNKVFKIMYDKAIIHRDIKPENILELLGTYIIMEMKKFFSVMELYKKKIKMESLLLNTEME